MTKRETGMLIGIGFNTVASLTAIGLWALAPPRGAPLTYPRGEATAAAPPRLLQQAPPFEQPPPRLSRRAASPPDDRAPDEAPARGALLQHQQRTTEDAAAPASVVALASRLHLDPQVLALHLGDARGEVPAPSADRLERGFKAGEALARRLDLDPSRTQSVVALFTYYVFSKLREEKASPSGVDPARLEALTDALLSDLRVTCGEDTAAAAASDLGGL